MDESIPRKHWEEIVSHPSDDGPRLTLASELLKNGDERADFITLDCEIARIEQSDPFGAGFRPYLYSTRSRLLRDFRDVWVGELAGFREQQIEFGFKRGMVECIRCPEDALLADVDRVFTHPDAELINELCLRDVQSWERVAACESLERFQTLDLRHHLPNNKMADVLSRSSRFRALESLLLGNGLYEGVKADLHPVFELLTDAGAQFIAESENFSNLRRLDLTMQDVGDAGAAFLAASANLAKLDTLQLAENSIGPRGLAALLASRTVRPRCIDLSNNSFGVEGATALVENDVATPYVVDLSNTVMGDGPLEISRNSRLFVALEVLHLRANGISDVGARALSAIPFGRLHTLTLDTNEICDNGLFSLLQAPWSAGLRALVLSRNRITNAGLQQLVQTERLRELRQLQLDDNRIDGDGIELLFAAENLPHLELLSVSGSSVDDLVVQRFVDTEQFRRLRFLTISQSSLTREYRQQLTEQFQGKVYLV